MSESVLQNIEFIRSIALHYDSSATRMTLLIPPESDKGKVKVFCSCSKGSYAKCHHAIELQNAYTLLLSKYNGALPNDEFLQSFFTNVYKPFIRVQPACVDNIKIIPDNTDSSLHIVNSTGKIIAIVHFDDSEMERFLGRIMPDKMSRLHYMRNAVTFLQTDQEKSLIAAGVKSQRQVMESSFWFLSAYHLFREYSEHEITASIRVDSTNARCELVWTVNNKVCMRSIIPDEIVPIIAEIVKSRYAGTGLNYKKGEHELLFRIDIDKKETFADILPCLNVPAEHKDTLIDIDERFIFERLVYLPSIETFFRLSPESMKLIADGWEKPKQIPFREISTFLEENGHLFSLSSTDNQGIVQDLFATSVNEINFSRIAYPPIITTFDHVELHPLSLNAHECSLKVMYHSDGGTIPLSRLIETKKKKYRFMSTTTHTVDLNSTDVQNSMLQAKSVGKNGVITIPRAALMRFRGSQVQTRITGNKELIEHIENMFAFKPLRTFRPLRQFGGTLREYQKHCVQWLLFLYDNSFGGLLCDEMGLGKTIESIAFLGALREQRECRGPHLVVCPASVIEYWERQLIRFLPGVKVHLHYAINRPESYTDINFDVMITTYGILRNDIKLLSSIPFNIVLFDEIQQLKNTASLSSVAAGQLCAPIKIGLTGTPLENNIVELRSLFNITIPGLFSTDFDSQTNRFMSNQNQNISDTERQSTRKVIEPFMMRRLKKNVLAELPEKIEETRFCSLIGKQAILYNEVLEERGGAMLESLKNSDTPIPYINFFALLTYLKQICNHPGSLSENTKDYIYSESGKWELFQELLDESLGSGQKVVIFSQYLKMIEIISLHLDMLNIQHAVLTGQTKKRDALVQKFAQDENCRVFICSLKAGGVGIDLTPASTVIHYDRWWNAAREDQATDRVHRFGQTRGVEVFKLVTRDSIEERIDRIIFRKKKLSIDILHTDNPDELKQFSREDLIEILSGITM